MKKRILFITHRNPQGYRIQQYFPFLEKRGFEVELCTTESTFLQLLERVRAADVVYIQRLLLSSLKLPVMRKLAKRIVFDYDDAIMYGAKGESPTRRRKFKRMIAAADAVLAGNIFLLEEAKRHRHDALHYVPTVVDTGEYPVKVHERSVNPVMGWIGSSSTLRYIRDIKGLIASFLKAGQYSFEVVADAPPDFELTGMIFRKWEKEKEKAILLNFDIGIMPLTDDTWSRGKCGLKLIQYMALGLPSITNPVGAANEIITDGVDGFLRTKLEEWETVAKELAADPDLRRKVGKAARETVEERYSLRVWGPRVAEIIDSL
ncbi:MAG: glycosyltransferase family 4 protein [Syntrophobacterales bacterium]|nr:glycosyltransferase family 4 protein [Syntrophobacterales bacterium]